MQHAETLKGVLKRVLKVQQAEQDEEDDQNSYDEKSENSFGIDFRRKISDKDVAS